MLLTEISLGGPEIVTLMLPARPGPKRMTVCGTTSRETVVPTLVAVLPIPSVVALTTGELAGAPVMMSTEDVVVPATTFTAIGAFGEGAEGRPVGGGELDLEEGVPPPPPPPQATVRMPKASVSKTRQRGN